MQIPNFRIERYFAKYEFDTPYLICCSDCETITVKDLLESSPGAEKDLFELRLGYTETQGNQALRDEIAKLYYQIGADEILMHAAGEEAIFTFMNAMLERGDHIIVHCPTYQSLFEIARSIGCEVTEWHAHEENGWALDINFLEKNIKANTKVLVINCPNNPTGYLMTKEMLCTISEIARERNLIIFSDEVYRFLEYNPEDRLPAICDINQNSVSLGALSKSLGMPGLRIGWIATRNHEALKKITAFKDYTTICNSSPSEFLATIALQQSEQIISANLALIESNLRLLNDFFARRRELFSWRSPKAGPIAFPSIQFEQNATDFCEQVLRSCGVLLLPGSIFDYTYAKNFRVGFGRKNMPECLEKFDEFVENEF